MTPYQVDLFEPPPPPLPKQFDFGEHCPTPGYFPPGGGDSQKAWDQIDLIEKKNWKALQAIDARWWCHFCNSWHDFDKFFFDSFDGVYPHEIQGDDLTWQRRFGGWEADLRRLFGLVGRSHQHVFRELTNATIYAFWAERNYERDTESGE